DVHIGDDRMDILRGRLRHRRDVFPEPVSGAANAISSAAGRGGGVRRDRGGLVGGGDGFARTHSSNYPSTAAHGSRSAPPPMKLCRFQPLEFAARDLGRTARSVHPEPRGGIIEENRVREINGELWGPREPTGRSCQLDAVKL